MEYLLKSLVAEFLHALIFSVDNSFDIQSFDNSIIVSDSFVYMTIFQFSQ